MKDLWFDKGLHFKCTECGKCCTGSPGYVWVDEEEAKKISRFLKIDLNTFYTNYTRIVKGRRALLEHPTTYDCVFLKGKKCSIYSLRPKQCRTFPWWKENLSSQASWDEAASRCEGIDHPDAPLIPFEKIQSQLT